ncbi:hypothetical protein O6H91_08G073200 [Diphasiastrum complanatum]|uniref:Uncharacterized protein n=2 Tax=Diphasiastrum complanatum TaxID=34168 RepID=A0ACC2CYS1_DIPCM|nr:hypothetical protein O6H91_08G072900 [Diphasiastrum complanatum]KAJ7547182.1 hypothetical protein O6H91_08G073200 [Diphasiastrum complanatum]
MAAARRRQQIPGLLYPQRKNAFGGSKHNKPLLTDVKKNSESVQSVFEDAERLSVTPFGSNNADDEYDDVEEVLKQFDLNMSYGPCLGISRLERWNRAHFLGKNPPFDIKGLLERAGGSSQSLWEGHI